MFGMPNMSSLLNGLALEYRLPSFFSFFFFFLFLELDCSSVKNLSAFACPQQGKPFFVIQPKPSFGISGFSL